MLSRYEQSKIYGGCMLDNDLTVNFYRINNGGGKIEKMNMIVAKLEKNIFVRDFCNLKRPLTETKSKNAKFIILDTSATS